MKIDDETFLTAYLDGELDSEQRLRVDSAMLSNPLLAEDLRELTAVRDVVSSLSGGALGIDLSGTVVAAIIRRREAGLLGRVFGPIGASRATRMIALVSSAAALVAAATMLLRWSIPDPADARFSARAIRPHGRAPSAPPAIGDGERSSGALVTTASHGGALSAEATREERQAERDRQQIHKLLDNPNLRKVLIVTDVVGDGDRQVGNLLEKTPRRNATYGRFTVSQGIVVDPDHPGDATVFAVVMDDHELQLLRKRLDQSFPENVAETEPRPEVVTELAEVGQVSVFPGTTVAIANVIVPSGVTNPARKDVPAKTDTLANFVPEAAATGSAGPDQRRFRGGRDDSEAPTAATESLTSPSSIAERSETRDSIPPSRKSDA